MSRFNDGTFRVLMNPRTTNSLAHGIACGIGAGALWGLVFLAPQVARGFGPLELAIGRYAAFGLISLILIAPRWERLRQHLHRHDWRTLCWLAISGNTLYYILLSGAVQMGGIAMTSLIIGFMPVAVTIIGSRDRGAVPLRRLVPSLILCIVGTFCIGWQIFTVPLSGSIGTQIAGLLCAVGALASWTCFAVSNRRALTRIEGISAQDWNLLMGVVTGAQILLLIPIAIILKLTPGNVEQWITLAGVSLSIAFFGSIMGNALWNRMSRLLPLTLVGQMILFETLFALVYGFLWEQRLPTWLETAAFFSVAAGVISCIAAHQPRRRNKLVGQSEKSLPSMEQLPPQTAIRMPPRCA